MSSAVFEEGAFADFDWGCSTEPTTTTNSVSDSTSNLSETSSDSSYERTTDVIFTPAHLKFLNSQLSLMSPEEILRWCAISLPNLYQETAFGPTGLVTLDLLSKLQGPIKPHLELIFLNTLHHFDETLDLVQKVQQRYPDTKLHVYKPLLADSPAQFAERYGEKLWETDEERYDWTAKVEPAERAYSELGVKAVLTGRRRAQGGARKNLDVLEVDDKGLIKVNPLANWTFEQVNDYIHTHDVPYNVLLDRGYKSVGDWHSTQPVAAGDDERAGRWQGRQKTECGIHNPVSRYAQYLKEMQEKEQLEQQQKAAASSESTASRKMTI